VLDGGFPGDPGSGILGTSDAEKERFEEFARKIISVPKSEIQEQERLYRERKREPKDS